MVKYLDKIFSIINSWFETFIFQKFYLKLNNFLEQEFIRIRIDTLQIESLVIFLVLTKMCKDGHYAMESD